MFIENDPRLTAYALGELVGDERLIFERELANAGGATAALSEIRHCGERIREAFACEPAYAMRAGQRAALLAGAGATSASALVEGTGEKRSDRILPWVTQTVISEVDKRKISDALRPSPWRRLRPVVGSLGVAAGVVWLVSIMLMREHLPKRSGGEVVSGEEGFPAITISHLDEPVGAEWARRRFAAARPGGGYPYRYGVPLAAASASPDLSGLYNPAIAGQRVSEFPAVVGLRSYDTLRIFMRAGLLPPVDQISVGQVLNAFEYGFDSPPPGETFAVATEVAECPWNPDRQLLQIGVTAAATAGEVVLEDVQMAVEFNPEKVAGYVLIGEKPASGSDAPGDLAEVSAGQSVTALYEVLPQKGAPGSGGDMVTVRVDFKIGDEGAAQSQETAVPMPARKSWRDASDDLRFAASVAGYGILLGGEKGEHPATYDLVLTLARDAIGDDPDGKREEFVEWVRKTIELKGESSSKN